MASNKKKLVNIIKKIPSPKQKNSLTKIIKKINQLKIIEKQSKTKNLETKIKKEKKLKEITKAIGNIKKKKEKQLINPIYQRFLDFLNTIYGPHDALEPYSPQIDYEKLFSYLGSGVKDAQNLDYTQNTPVKKQGELSTTEAEKVMQKVYIAKVFQQNGTMGVEERERFNYWQEFAQGKVWLKYFENTLSIRSRDINWGAVNQPCVYN